MACSKGHSEIVDHLLTAKADVNLQRKVGNDLSREIEEITCRVLVPQFYNGQFCVVYKQPFIMQLSRMCIMQLSRMCMVPETIVC